MPPLPPNWIDVYRDDDGTLHRTPCPVALVQSCGAEVRVVFAAIGDHGDADRPGYVASAPADTFARIVNYRQAR